MIEKHYGKYIRNDSVEQLSRLFGDESETLSETLATRKRQKVAQVVRKLRGRELVGPPGLEPGTNRL